MHKEKPRKLTVLFIEPRHSLHEPFIKTCASNNIEAVVVRTAQKAVEIADESNVDVIVTELSLAGHSGFELIYEFRSYIDWQSIDIMIYTDIELDKKILGSKTWKRLGISGYYLKSQISILQLVDKIAMKKLEQRK